MDQSDLAARLDAIEARNAISEVVYRYAQAVRTGDHAMMCDVFTKDATFTVMRHNPKTHELTRMIHREGTEQLEKFYAEVTSRRDTAPLVHNLIIEVNGNEATGSCVMSGAAMDGQPKFLGYYSDTFRREDKWRFTSRVYTVYMEEGAGG